MKYVNEKVLLGADNFTTIGDQIDANQIIRASFHTFFDDPFAQGSIKLQGSNDLNTRGLSPAPFVATHWVDLPNQSIPIVDGASALLTLEQSSYRWIRAVFTNTAMDNAVQQITPFADVSGSLRSKYFTINSIDPILTVKGFYVWYNDGSGVDPALPGKTGVQINYTDNASALTIANLTNTALNALTNDFTSTVNAVTYPNTVLAQNPIGYWRLQETSGTVAANEGTLGSAEDGTYSGGVTLGQTGAPIVDTGNTSALFNGSSGKITIPQNAAFEFSNTSNWSISGWLKLSATGLGTARDLVRVDSGGSGRNLWFLGVNTADKLETTFGAVFGTLQTVTAATAFTDTGWHHFALSVGSYGTPLVLYVDGVAVATTTNGVATWATDPYDLAIAAYIGAGGPSEFFGGNLEEIAIFDSALTLQQVTDQYNSPPLLVVTNVNAGVVPDAADGTAPTGFDFTTLNPGVTPTIVEVNMMAMSV